MVSVMFFVVNFSHGFGVNLRRPVDTPVKFQMAQWHNNWR